MKTRRDFLAVTTASLAAAMLPQTILGESRIPDVFSNANLGAYGQGLLTQATFERLIGSTFTAFVGTDLYAFLTLRSVTDLVAAATARGNSASKAVVVPAPRSKAATTITSFYLDFTVSGAPFAQATYTLDHGILGRFAAFLVPSKAATAPSCGATFSYLSEPATLHK